MFLENYPHGDISQIVEKKKQFFHPSLKSDRLPVVSEVVLSSKVISFVTAAAVVDIDAK